MLLFYKDVLEWTFTRSICPQITFGTKTSQ